MPASVKILPHYTYDDWVNWEGQWELIDGIPYAMSPAPVPKHQRIAANILAEFRMELKKCKKCHVYQPIDYKVMHDTILQPDMLIVCSPINKAFLDFPPALVVEILSPSTALKDRHSKFGIYQQQQVKYYLTVSPDNEQVEIFEIENGVYSLKQSGRNISNTFALDHDCTVTVNFSEIW